jgi:hypothetical protein
MIMVCAELYAQWNNILLLAQAAWRGVAWRGVAWRGVAWRGAGILRARNGRHLVPAIH